MKINGEDVVFGKYRHRNVVGHSYASGSYTYHEVKQRWDLPILGLYGYVDTNQSLGRIERDIQQEVNLDLENRERVKQGLPKLRNCWTVNGCC